MFVNNKYYTWYSSLISHAKSNTSRSKKTGSYDLHHIVPKSLGGDNSKDNLVLLTYREHYLAHMLLVRCVEKKHTYRMVSALARFFKKVAATSKSYELYKLTMSKYSKGEYNSAYGKIWVHRKDSGEIEFISAKKFDEDIYFKGLPFQRGGYTGYTWLHKGTERCAVPKDKVSGLLTDGWSLGRNVSLGDQHHRKMVSARHTKEKDQRHGQLLTGRVAVRMPHETSFIRVDPSRVQDYLRQGYILHKNSKLKSVTSGGKPVTINGIEYKSMSEAHRQTGIPYSRIIKMNK